MLRTLVTSGKVISDDTVLEIGPGEGVLTEALLATGADIIAIEKDRDLIPLLNEKFSAEIASGQLRLIEADVLDFDPAKVGLHAGTYKLIANIPYYITGAIFEKFLTEKNPPSLMVMLIQKEVATRIVARDKKESILSLSVKAFGVPKIVAKVPASAFRPAPKVDSAILLVEDISNEHFPSAEAIDTFFKVVRAGFAHKRKLLARNLEVVAEKESISKAFGNLTISANARAEDLALPVWLSLARVLTGHVTIRE